MRAADLKELEIVQKSWGEVVPALLALDAYLSQANLPFTEPARLELKGHLDAFRSATRQHQDRLEILVAVMDGMTAKAKPTE